MPVFSQKTIWKTIALKFKTPWTLKKLVFFIKQISKNKTGRSGLTHTSLSSCFFTLIKIFACLHCPSILLLLFNSAWITVSPSLISMRLASMFKLTFFDEACFDLIKSLNLIPFVIYISIEKGNSQPATLWIFSISNLVFTDKK